MTTKLPSRRDIKDFFDSKNSFWVRKEEQKWTNCEWEIYNYFKNWREHKVFVKKTFLKFDVSKFEKEYRLIKQTFWNIIPNQSFINNDNEIFAFCIPIDIKSDFLLKENRDYLLELLSKTPRLLKQLKFFVRKYETLLSEWKVLDLYWKENLVVSDNNKLYYIDSFFLFQDDNKYLKGESLKNLEYLKSIILEVEKNNS